ncbi:MAG TPA: hypothetical protein VFX55_14305 [Duganella sp.]|nr:hypothetical protein [Duganella sp.]
MGIIPVLDILYNLKKIDGWKRPCGESDTICLAGLPALVLIALQAMPELPIPEFRPSTDGSRTSWRRIAPDISPIEQLLC